MQHLKKLTMTLVLLIMTAAGAWAEDIVISPADGDISAALTAASEGKTVGNITINLTAGVTYTISSTIVAPASLTINGNGATIDANGLEANMIQGTGKNAATKVDIAISDLSIIGLKKALYYSNDTYNHGDFTVDNCMVMIAANAKTFDYTQGSAVENFIVTNSTFYAPTATETQFYSSQGGEKLTNINESGIQKFSFQNCTMYNLAPTKNFFTHRENSKTYQSYEAKNTIFVNCGKSGEVIKGMNGGATSANPTWNIDGNAFNFGGQDTGASETTGDTNEPVKNTVAGVVVFADAANGDFTLGDCAARTAGIGDPRWLVAAGPEVTLNDTKTVATMTMPANDVTVSYELVRDMEDATSPVVFSGVPTEPVVVKKGDDGKYQPAEAPVFQLNDPLAVADAQNIIAADGIIVSVEQKGDGDAWTALLVTLDAFLADMQPGTYRLVATPTDETSLYDGIVTSAEFTVAEKYDLVVEPADDFSKGKIESVTVGTETITPDAEGKATKTGIEPETEVKIKAKRGYVIEKVEAKKAAAARTLAEATAEDIGKVVCADGHLHDAKTAVPAGCTAVGIVGKVTSEGHGLILALQNATSQTWNTINGWESVTTYASTTLKLLPDDAARGANLTSYTTLGSTAVSNWAVAQKSDYNAIFINLGSAKYDPDGYTYDDNVNAYITGGVGGTAINGNYWSATGGGSNNAWLFHSVYWEGYDKTNSRYVRPVLGFLTYLSIYPFICFSRDSG